MKDGSEHNEIRRSFPSFFMVYKLTEEKNKEWLEQVVATLLDSIAEREANKKNK